MPYRVGSSSLPDNVKGLAAPLQRLWVKAFNDTYHSHQADCEDPDSDQCKAACEKAAFSAANGVLKRAKNMATDLETETLPDVEILKVGTWNGDDYDRQDLEDIADAFGDLPFSPPAKLGHDEKQRILQNSGYPAAGYVASLRVEGDRLLATLRDVPKKLAAVIRAKGYSKISSEVWFNFRYEGKRYAKVLRAVALLGANVPAVMNIDDIVSMYGLDEATIKTYYTEPSEDEGPKLITYTAGTVPTSTKERRMDKETLGLLGLPEDATDEQIAGAVKGLHEKTKEDPEPKPPEPTPGDPPPGDGQSQLVSREEYRALQQQVGSLSAENAKNAANAAVEDAKREGKILPAQEEWARTYAVRDLEGFKAYCAQTPAFPLGAVGSETAPDIDRESKLSREEEWAAKQLGIDTEKVQESKKAALTA